MSDAATDFDAARGALSAGADIRSPSAEFWRKFKKQKIALVAGVFVVVLVIVAVLAPWIVPYDAETFFDYDKLNAPPSLQHWMGVDALGRDIFSRILMGARISLAAGFVSVAIGAFIGTILGLIAGYFEGWWDRVIMRVCDVLFAFPGILLAIGIVAILGGGMENVIFAVIVYFSLRIGTSIITAASLSFLGLGAQPPTPEWGAMLNSAQSEMLTAPHAAIFPALAIFFTVLAFNLLGDGLRDALDPKLERR